MSIEEEIQAHCAEKRLFRLSPKLPGTMERRSIYNSIGINEKLLLDPRDGAKEQARWVRLQVYMDRFLEKKDIMVAADPRDARDAYLSRLEPANEEIWEIRSREKPAIRVFGAFAVKDVFIAILWGWRKDLGGFESPEFKEAKRECGRRWELLFPGHDRLTGEYPDDYITGGFLNRDT